ncbi:cyclase family protein [Flavobacterium agricola]|uniref:Cyclase family protein n=1 Tax=Flavobacterium agricola TaxID=2870839 RepID=A0ABY6LY91_9FLAO|nr:cyclase family protein [Flavobacterium agricola]UYW01309.1 cyclase family protein [Flavobacterium agricola]
MKATLEHQNQKLVIDLANPLDISLPIENTAKNPIAWYLSQPEITPVVMGDFVGSVRSGKSATNFNNILFNPHGHGTHTECLGHITQNFYSINQTLKKFVFVAELISITPELQNRDYVLTANQIQKALNGKKPEALIIRTLPNLSEKKHKNYSNTNPPYLSEAAAQYIKEINVSHLLIDLPSVDKEKDNGALVAHKAFWNLTNVIAVNSDARWDCTITELIFVSNQIPDGTYVLNLQIASFENDASPSKPILYQIL